jgi:hypothetical protein
MNGNVKGALIAAGLTGVVLAVLFSLGALVGSEGGRRNREPVPAVWAPVVDELVTFVENERGLKFKDEVSMVFQTEKEFLEEIEGDSADYYQPDAADSYIALKALNLVDGELDLETMEDPLQGGGLAGFYDSVTEELVVQGTDPTPFVRMVLVHELTHALQDQHFDLDQVPADTEESYTAYASLVEGDATRIENAYFESLSPEDQALVESEGQSPFAGTEDPSIQTLAMLSGFPYEVGARFVDDILRQGGQARVDQAFKSPPTTTEQVLHTERFLNREDPAKVDSPKAEAKVIEEGIWGERGLLTMLLQTIDRDQALQAAEGWNGDYYVAWKRGGTDCIRMSIATDTAKDKAELFEALTAWSFTQPTASVTNGKTILIRACA